MRHRLYILSPADRLAIVPILVKAGYCVKEGKEKQGNKSILFIEYWQEGGKYMNGENLLKHGLYRTRLNIIWNDMKQRCFNKNHSFYNRYGGRGITACDEWTADFLVFYNWAMANGYSDKLTLDRIDNDGNYEPANCRWSTRKEQSNNRITNRALEYNGEIRTMSQWADVLGLTYDTVQNRIRQGWTMERIVKTPMRKQRRSDIALKVGETS